MGTRRRPGLEACPRRLSTGLDSPGLGAWIFLDSLGLAWIALDSLGLSLWISLDFVGFPWLHIQTFQRVRIHRRGIGRFFSAPRPRRRAAARAIMSSAKARIARRGCGMGDGDLAFCACNAQSGVLLLFSQAKGAPHAAGQLRNGKWRRPLLMRTPAERASHNGSDARGRACDGGDAFDNDGSV